VTIKPSDVGFENNGYELTGDLSAVLPPNAVIPNGVFIVGTDLRPGTYRTSGDCYWARLSAFTGGLDTIIANDNISGLARVAIAAGDKGFESNGCPGWKRE
jgi:hypothetical protein